MGDGDAPPNGYPVGAAGKYGKNSGELGVVVETTVDLHQDKA